MAYTFTYPARRVWGAGSVATKKARELLNVSAREVPPPSPIASPLQVHDIWPVRTHRNRHAHLHRHGESPAPCAAPRAARNQARDRSKDSTTPTRFWQWYSTVYPVFAARGHTRVCDRRVCWPGTHAREQGSDTCSSSVCAVRSVSFASQSAARAAPQLRSQDDSPRVRGVHARRRASVCAGARGACAETTHRARPDPCLLAPADAALLR